MFTHPSVASPEVHDKLQAVREACLKGRAGLPRGKGTSFSRVYDLAIDFAEEEPVLPLSAAEENPRRVRVDGRAREGEFHPCERPGFGDYDKLTMTELFLREVLQEDGFFSAT